MEKRKLATKILVIAGPSGCGKSYITDRLLEEYPNIFEKLRQVTTREKREGEGDQYDYLSEEEYNDIKDDLIARTKIGDNWYGTRLTGINNSKIKIIIANKMGIEDLERIAGLSIVYLGIDSEIPAKRDKRDIEFVNHERDSLKEIVPEENWLFNTKENYITTHDVMEIMLNYFWN